MSISGTFVRPKPLQVGLVKRLFDRIEELEDDREVGPKYDTLVFSGVKRITDAAVLLIFSGSNRAGTAHAEIEEWFPLSQLRKIECDPDLYAAQVLARQEWGVSIDATR